MIGSLISWTMNRVMTSETWWFMHLFCETTSLCRKLKRGTLRFLHEKEVTFHSETLLAALTSRRCEEVGSAVLLPEVQPRRVHVLRAISLRIRKMEIYMTNHKTHRQFASWVLFHWKLEASLKPRGCERNIHMSYTHFWTLDLWPCGWRIAVVGTLILQVNLELGGLGGRSRLSIITTFQIACICVTHLQNNTFLETRVLKSAVIHCLSLSGVILKIVPDRGCKWSCVELGCWERKNHSHVWRPAICPMATGQFVSIKRQMVCKSKPGLLGVGFSLQRVGPLLHGFLSQQHLSWWARVPKQNNTFRNNSYIYPFIISETTSILIVWSRQGLPPVKSSRSGRGFVHLELKTKL